MCVADRLGPIALVVVVGGRCVWCHGSVGSDCHGCRGWWSLCVVSRIGKSVIVVVIGCRCVWCHSVVVTGGWCVAVWLVCGGVTVLS